ncbi:MAG: TRAP transporter large permease subunit [Chloroflexota bacterium]
MVGVISFLCLFALILTSIPIGFAMAFVGFVGFAVIVGWKGAFTIAALTSWDTVAHYSFSVIPMFLFMGNLAFRARIGEDAFRTARLWVGHIRGGLTHSTIVAGAVLGAATGSSIASAATLAKIAVPEMKRYGYSTELAAGSVAAAGCLASMIPPSTAQVLFAMVTQQSISKLLIAGILPGILLTVIYMIAMLIYFRIRPGKFGGKLASANWGERLKSAKNVAPVAFIFLMVMGSMYTGIATPTEAAAVGATSILIASFVMRRMNLRTLWEATVDTTVTTAMVFVILVGALIFNNLLAVSRIPAIAADYISALPVPPLVVLLAIMAMYIFLGMFMEGPSMLFLTMPTIFPIAQAMGWNPIWFGILYMMIAEVGMITPPVGATLFGTKSSLPDVTMAEIYRGIIPFFFADIVVLALLIAFPQISLLLPGLMK